ncbi:ankyrin repeat-containing protein NPR4-like [Pistacia vera]|uniref:ankyrin repeat-containing protein NPR4-like n=1 Tax=Pistacia vera TaxID=55513 RepID=UPI0012638BFA|nr:ankyrin repeat-containing protein NPR4-like [Pistacia vera]
MYRQLNIFNIIYDIGSFKDLLVQKTDKKRNNILHLAAKIPGKYRHHTESGKAAVQLKEELLWFKKVKEILHPWDAEAKNKKGKTARALFIEQHQVLRDKAEKWIKEMVSACLMGAKIIATVVFAAAFTVPGGTKEETGSPNLVRRASFILFGISDAIALLLSCFSVLKFLSVIYSRYEEEDFILHLLYDLKVGLSLFVSSVGAMMVVFCATMFIVFQHGMLWVPVLITTMAVFACFVYCERLLRAIVDVPHPATASGSPFKEEK